MRRTFRALTMSVLIALITTPLIAQQRGGAAAPAGPPMTMTVAGFTDGGQIPVKFTQAAPGVATGEGLSPAITWTNAPAGTQVSSSTCTTWTSRATRPPTIRRTGWSGTFRRRRPACPKACRRARSWPTAATRSARPARCIAVPARRPTARTHHYMFEIYALDTKLDVQPAADAFETRANVMKAMQGHILGKAVYGGLFKRPQ